MVSTRGIRYKFSEGERVLCYEPDPTKAKVLYDSKVLEVIESKDKRGRRTVEYLIHFQGWNSSWDRCVSEDFVLKDTEENRQLQRDLAEKSQLQLGAYLYRRERKKGSSSTASGAGPAKRTRQGFSDDGSSSSTQPDGSVCVTTEGEAGDTDSSSGSGSATGSSGQRRSPPPPHVGRAHITLPSALRDRLTFDYHLVVKRGKLSRLPATPCAAEILESFVKWFARAGAWHPRGARHDPPQKPDLLDVSCRLNMVREVADGLRVYFDFVVRGHLLYKQELPQYHHICGQFLEDQEMDVSTEADAEEAEGEEAEAEAEAEADSSQEDSAVVEEELKSPKIPEYSHLPPDPTDKDTGLDVEAESSVAASSRGAARRRLTRSRSERADDRAAMQRRSAAAAAPQEKEEEESSKMDTSEKGNKSDSAPEDAPPPAARTSYRARRLRSHKSAVSQSESEEPAPSTSAADQRTFETLSSSGSSMSGSWAPPAPAAPPAHTRTPLSLLFDKVAKWQIIPREGTEHLPCRVYGAIHLARLFVKLPDFLNATQMPDFKLKLVIKHIEMFVQYLDEHSEWFGEMYYTADNMSRSH